MENSQKHEANGRVPSLTRSEVMTKLDKKLNEKLASRKSEIEELTTANAATKNVLKMKCNEIKQIRNETKNLRRVIQAAKGTLECLKNSQKHLSVQLRMKENDVKQYEEETLWLNIEQKERLANIKSKWNSFKANYETLPLAVLRNEKETELMKEKINLMLSKAKLADMNKILAMREEIKIKMRNNEIIECAQLYLQIKFEDLAIRDASAKEKTLRDKICKQESQIAELQQIQMEQLAARKLNKAGGKQVLMFEPFRIRCRAVPRFDLPAMVDPMPQLIPEFCKKDFDTVSMSSSVFDNLLDINELPENSEPLKPNVVGSEDEENQNFTDDNQRLDDQNPRDEGLEMSAGGELPARENMDSDEAGNVDEVENENADEIARELNKEVHTVDSINQRTAMSKPVGQSFLHVKSKPEELREVDEIKRPRIANIERVQLNFPPRNLIEQKIAKDAGNSLAGYFAAPQSAAPSLDSSWKPEGVSRFSSFAELQRDPDLVSNFGSDMSMFTEEIKEFHTPFSPDLGKMDKSQNLGEDSGNLLQFGQMPKGFLNSANFRTPSKRAVDEKNKFFGSIY